MKILTTKLIRHVWFYVWFSILFLSCNNKKEKNPAIIPQNIIKKETMVSVLVDMHLLEASRNLNFLQPKDSTGIQLGVNMDKYNLTLLKKYGITKAQFDTSFAFYTTYPSLLNGIYEECLSELSRVNAAVQQ